MRFLAKLLGLNVVALDEVPFEPTSIDGKLPLVKTKNFAITA